MPGSTRREQAGTSARDPRPRRRRRGRRSPASGSRDSTASACRCPGARQASRIVVPSGTRHRLAVDRQLDQAALRAGPAARGWAVAADRRMPSIVMPPALGRRIADSIALDAVWPRPQIDASRIAWPISSSSASSSRPMPAAGRAASRCEQLLLAHRADAAGHALAARLVAEEGGDAPQDRRQVDAVVEDHDDARAERRPDGARRPRRSAAISSSSGPTKTPGGAAEQDRLQCAPSAGARRPPSSSSSRRVVAERHLVEARPRDVPGDAE